MVFKPYKSHVLLINFCIKMCLGLHTFFIFLCDSSVLKILTFKALFLSSAFSGCC